MSGSLEFLDVGSMPQHGKMIVNPQEAGKGKAGGDKLMRRSMSNEAGLSAVASRTGFWLPSVVLVLPVKEKSVEEGAMQWDFDLLAEDEVRPYIHTHIEKYASKNGRYRMLDHKMAAIECSIIKCTHI